MPAQRLPQPLETGRLLLRPREVGEAGVYRRLWTERDARVPAHRRIDAAGRPSVGDVAAQVRAERERPRAGLGLLAVVRRGRGDVVGYCGLVPGSGPGEVELAFELLRAVHGRGYATEAGGAVLAWADRSGYQRVWASVWAWNTASRRVLAKLGFDDSGQGRSDPVHADGLMMVRARRDPPR